MARFKPQVRESNESNTLFIKTYMVEWEIGLERHVELLQLFGATEADECNWEERKTPSE